MSSVYERIVAQLRNSAVFPADKPDETPETTARALWFVAADGNRRVAEPLPTLSPAQQQVLAGLVARRITGEPLAHLTGRTVFMGLEFLTGPDALIPRRETELLCGAALELVRGVATTPVRVLDLCTGSGNLAVSLAVHEPRVQVWASDIDLAAVAMAGRNAAHHKVADRVTLLHGDLFGALESPQLFDIVVANAPYIPTRTAKNLPVEVAGFEPAVAFDGGDLGVTYLYRLIAEAPQHLVPGGWLGFELGAGMGRLITKRLAAQGAYGEPRTVANSAGITRAILAQTLPYT